MQNYRISMLRHGMTEGNRTGRYIGATDSPLSPEGKEQLEDLLALYDYPKVEKVYTSPLTRAVETARILYPEHRLQPIDGLQEYHFGIFENRSIDELSADPRYQAWVSGSMEEAPDGGESREAFAQRVTAGFCQVLSDMMEHGIFSAALIGHAGVLSALLSQFCVPKRSPIEWKWESGQGYLLLTSAQMWTRDHLLEVASSIPYGRAEWTQAEYGWFDYSPPDASSDT